ncbi:unnamed protein product [Closterium sp. Naga37s-1]|nr:unnamed protein product [Closterium sp. Naga37s-1]
MEVVRVSFADLKEGKDLSAQIEAAFGPGGLGIIAVSDVPGYPEAREQLLPLALRLGELPEEAKRRIEDPDSKYSFGWSEGKESVEAGRRDALKASFYANPLTDTPTTDPEFIRRFPTYCRPNVWPSQDLPELEPAFKALSRMIVDVGKQLLQHCDSYVHSRNPHVPPGKLLRVVEQSPCHKARLLLYLPPQQPPPTPPAAQGEGQPPVDTSRASREEEAVACAGNGGDGGASASESLTAVADADVSSWCGWHLDHGSLTGLTRAQFWRGGEALEGSELDPSCGLYIRTRDGQIVQARIPEGCIAFQVGHAMSIQSGGLLAATPHCVAPPLYCSSLPLPLTVLMLLPAPTVLQFTASSSHCAHVAASPHCIAVHCLFLSLCSCCCQPPLYCSSLPLPLTVLMLLPAPTVLQFTASSSHCAHVAASPHCIAVHCLFLSLCSCCCQPPLYCSSLPLPLTVLMLLPAPTVLQFTAASSHYVHVAASPHCIAVHCLFLSLCSCCCQPPLYCSSLPLPLTVLMLLPAPTVLQFTAASSHCAHVAASPHCIAVHCLFLSLCSCCCQPPLYCSSLPLPLTVLMLLPAPTVLQFTASSSHCAHVAASPHCIAVHCRFLSLCSCCCQPPLYCSSLPLPLTVLMLLPAPTVLQFTASSSHCAHVAASPHCIAVHCRFLSLCSCCCQPPLYCSSLPLPLTVLMLLPAPTVLQFTASSSHCAHVAASPHCIAVHCRFLSLCSCCCQPPLYCSSLPLPLTVLMLLPAPTVLQFTASSSHCAHVAASPHCIAVHCLFLSLCSCCCQPPLYCSSLLLPLTVLMLLPAPTVLQFTASSSHCAHVVASPHCIAVHCLFLSLCSCCCQPPLYCSSLPLPLTVLMLLPAPTVLQFTASSSHCAHVAASPHCIAVHCLFLSLCSCCCQPPLYCSSLPLPLTVLMLLPAPTVLQFTASSSHCAHVAASPHCIAVHCLFSQPPPLITRPSSSHTRIDFCPPCCFVPWLHPIGSVTFLPIQCHSVHAHPAMPYPPAPAMTCMHTGAQGTGVIRRFSRHISSVHAGTSLSTCRSAALSHQRSWCHGSRAWT